MAKIINDKDSLTNIHNEVYLKTNYQSYITKYPNAKFIMFDFKNFKHFNDTFGHDTGDLYLKLFAGILEENFKDSIVVRLHGDEYCVLTKYSTEEIEKIFDVCDAKIKISYEAGFLPEIFSYNAGIVNAEHGIANTTEKADYMMYHAKKKNQRSQVFEESIWDKKMKEDEFINLINRDASKSDFAYSIQDLYTSAGNKANIQSVYTRSSECESLFLRDRYSFIRDNSQLKKIDLFNMQHLLLKLDSKKEAFILCFDYKSLLSKTDLISYLDLLVNVMKLNSKNITISININDLEAKNFLPVLTIIEEIKKLGFNICLDKYSSKTGDHVYENAHIDYIKFDAEYWKNALVNEKTDYLLKSKINMFTSYFNPSTPIFTCVERENEYSYLTSITKSPILLSGNYLEAEKKLVLKKD